MSLFASPPPPFPQRHFLSLLLGTPLPPTPVKAFLNDLLLNWVGFLFFTCFCFVLFYSYLYLLWKSGTSGCLGGHDTYLHQAIQVLTQ